ncbi:Putative AC transposase [Linum perenne]
MENPNNSQNNVPATPTQTQTPPNAATPPVQQPSTEAVLIGAETVVAADGQGYPQGEIQQVQSSGRKLKSDVWPHFQRLQVNGELKAKCIYCRKLLCGHSNNGTTHLRNHRDGCIQKKIHDGRQKILGPNFIGKIQPDLTVGQFSSEASKKELGIMIIMHEYPLAMVDHLYFKRFCCSLQPLFKVPTRNTMRKEIYCMYRAERSRIMKEMEGTKSRIAITTDMWTATNQKRGYMAVTAHYIDNTWNLRSYLMRFLYVPAPHTGERLAARLSECLIEWNIDSKLSTITLDNCTTNDSLIEFVKRKLVLSDLIKDGSLLHMRCSAHIINLIVKDGLDVIRDGIEKIRASVLYWTCTPRRVEKFKDTARQLQITFEKALVMDCSTRWNSTYEMLSVAIPYKDVFCRLKIRDHQYTTLPSSNDWEFAYVVCEKLRIFNTITDLFSGTNYPTANIFFPKVCDIRMALMEWLYDPNPLICDMANKMWLKFAKYWDDIHLVLAVSVVLDPRYKLHVIEYYADKFGSTNVDIVGERVKNVVCDLVLEYQRKTEKKSSTSSAKHDVNVPTSSTVDLDFELYVRQRKKSKATSVTTELDHYLAEALIPRTSVDFDVLMWWRLNGAKYPTLQEMARDLLAIPITSVASESAFSSGGRLLDPHRSRLHFSLVEAMMCTRSWIKDDMKRGNSLILFTLCLCYLISFEIVCT